MNKKLLFAALFVATFTFSAIAQFTKNDIQYWIGSGSDTAIMVVDFRDASFDSSYAWGYLFNGPETGGDMIQAIANADPNLTINLASGFLNDIVYNTHQGIGGSPDYWSTWSGTSTSNFSMNAGLGSPINNGDWFGFSYGFTPAPLAPANPIAAFNPAAFTITDVEYFIGTGSDTAMLVIDFNDNPNSSYAWGILFNDSISGEDILAAIGNADNALTIATGGGFLNDIHYNSHSGIGGNPNYWGTWSASNFGNWELNVGLSTMVKNGEFFGCSYTDFNPALRPSYPTAVQKPLSQSELNTNVLYSIYPIPTNDYIHIQSINLIGENFKIINTAGKVIVEKSITSPTETVDIQNLKTGVYFMIINNNIQKLIKN